MADFAISAVARKSQATANGSTTQFSFAFSVNVEADIAVFVNTTQKTISTHYTVSITANTGAGSITFTSGNTPGNGQIVTIMSKTALARASVYTSGGTINAAALEGDFDTNMMLFQQQDERLDRSLTAPVDDATSIDMNLPNKDARKGKVLGFNSTSGNPEATQQVTGAAVNVSAVSAGGSPTSSVSVSGGTATFAIGIPAGATGAQGNTGNTGNTGSQGPAGDNTVNVKDEGSALSTAASSLNFVGAGVVASGTGAEKTITITDNNTTYSVGDGGLTQNNFTNTLKSKLDGIEASATSNVTHSGEVTGSTSLTISDNVVDEANLKVSNSPTNGYTLTSQSGANGGLTWAPMTEAGSGEANQNAFSNVAVSGQNTVAADAAADTLNLAAGSNVSITTNASSDTVTIAATDTNTTYSVGDGGLTQNNFTNAFKTKLDGVASSANNYSHPSGAGNNHIPTGGSSNQVLTYSASGVAVWANAASGFTLPTSSSSTLGGVKVGTNLSINGSGVLSATDTNTTYSVQDGGLSEINFTSDDHTKLNGVEASANNYSHPNGNGNEHIPANGSAGQFLKYDHAGTAVWAADNNTTYSVGDGGLTTNDFTNSDHSKLNGIASGATAFTNSNAVSAVTAAHLDMGGKRVLFGNLYSAVSDLPSASTYHGMFAHVHATGLGYYAHAGAWVPLARSSDIPTVGDGGLTTNNFTDADHSKLNGIEASATADQTGAQIRAAVEAASDSNIFTDADHTKLNGIAASANNYSPPNHTGEITSSGDGATVIAGNVVDEANLKVSNGPVDGYMLTAQSGNTGGLTWAAQPSTSLPSLAGAGKVLTINAGNSASVWATPSGGGVSEDTVIALTIALG